MSQNNETAAMFMFQTRPLEVQLFRMENRSFVPVSLHSCWPREKRLSIAIRNRICAVSYSILSHFRKLIRLRNKQVKIIDSAGQNKQVGNQKGLQQRKNGAFLPT